MNGTTPRIVVPWAGVACTAIVDGAGKPACYRLFIYYRKVPGSRSHPRAVLWIRKKRKNNERNLLNPAGVERKR